MLLAFVFLAEQANPERLSPEQESAVWFQQNAFRNKNILFSTVRTRIWNGVKISTFWALDFEKLMLIVWLSLI